MSNSSRKRHKSINKKTQFLKRKTKNNKFLIKVDLVKKKASYIGWIRLTP